MWQVEAAVGVDDIEETLNDLLSRWHRWARGFAYVAGYDTVSLAMEPFRASRQYDAENGALDQDVENEIMATVDACIDRVQQPFRTALAINARNLCTGSSVWRSARLPEDAMERALMVAEARSHLVHQLSYRGVL